MQHEVIHCLVLSLKQHLSGSIFKISLLYLEEDFPQSLSTYDCQNFQRWPNCVFKFDTHPVRCSRLYAEKRRPTIAAPSVRHVLWLFASSFCKFIVVYEPGMRTGNPLAVTASRQQEGRRAAKGLCFDFLGDHVTALFGKERTEEPFTHLCLCLLTDRVM